jgi:hypothetical protein
MQTTFAVQPAAFASFDEWGCMWATDIDHAYRLARQEATSGEDQVIWRCAPQGNPIKWVTVAGEGIA